LNAQEKVVPGATEDSPSHAHYFTWINNTNEGPTAEQTKVSFLKASVHLQPRLKPLEADSVYGLVQMVLETLRKKKRHASISSHHLVKATVSNSSKWTRCADNSVMKNKMPSFV
jgi:hypothetical protein